MKELYDLKEMLCKELKEYGEKGEMTAGTLDVVDKLTHTIKNLDKIIEVYEDEGYSNHYPYYMGGSYDDGMNRNGSYRGRSYAGRRNARRDSMGRYSREGLADKMRDLMDEAPDERTRQEIQRMIDKFENA